MKLVLGTVQFGLNYGINNPLGKPSDIIYKSILNKAYSSGIKFLDTAEAYGDAQERIGLYHKVYKNKFKIITKFCPTVKNLPSNISERIFNNLKIMNIDNLYCYMFHSFNDFILFYKQFKKDLCSLKNNGFIENIGVSLYSNDEVESILKYDCVDIIQIPYNLLDNFSKRNDIINKAKHKGLQVHTRSVFLQGLFFIPLSKLRGNLSPLKTYLYEIHNRIKANNLSIGELALNYSLRNKNIDKVIVGVDSVEQLNKNLNWIKSTINDDLFDFIDQMDIIENNLLNPSFWK